MFNQWLFNQHLFNYGVIEIEIEYISSVSIIPAENRFPLVLAEDRIEQIPDRARVIEVLHVLAEIVKSESRIINVQHEARIETVLPKAMQAEHIEYIYTVFVENRIYEVEAEDRYPVVLEEDRIYAVPQQNQLSQLVT